MIQGFASGFGRFESDGQLLFRLRLPDEFAQPPRAQFELKTLLFVSARGAYQAIRKVIVSNAHA